MSHVNLYCCNLKEHCVKCVRIWSYSGPYFPAFGMNMERYSVSLRIHSKCGKIRTGITPNTDTFHAVEVASCFSHISNNFLEMLIRRDNFIFSITVCNDRIEYWVSIGQYLLKKVFGSYSLLQSYDLATYFVQVLAEIGRLLFFR